MYFRNDTASIPSCKYGLINTSMFWVLWHSTCPVIEAEVCFIKRDWFLVSPLRVFLIESLHLDEVGWCFVFHSGKSRLKGRQIFFSSDMPRIEHKICHKMADMRKPRLWIIFLPIYESSEMSLGRGKNSIAIHRLTPVISRIFIFSELQYLNHGNKWLHVNKRPIRLTLIIAKSRWWLRLRNPAFRMWRLYNLHSVSYPSSTSRLQIYGSKISLPYIVTCTRNNLFDSNVHRFYSLVIEHAQPGLPGRSPFI